MIRNISIFFVLAIAAIQNSYGQGTTRTITGLVTSYDESAPLEGVAVSVKGTPKASGTQPDGVYYIEVSKNDSVLVFSRNEFQTVEVKLSAASEYNISLRKGQALAQVNQTAAFSATGSWRGVFQIKPGVEVPINFDISKAKGGGLELYFLNAEERFFGGPVKQVGDSLLVSLDEFDNELAFGIGGNTLAGVLRHQDKSGFSIPIKAEVGETYRFRDSGIAPAGDISGTYDIILKSATGKEEKAVGLFKQDGNKLRGTFLRITGDSRYLEGIVEGNNFYLSSFIGSIPGYYKGSFTKDGQLTGEIVGARGSQNFTGTLNEEAALPDPYSLTFLKQGYNSFGFSFPDVNGKTVSLNDEKFKNKVVIVTVTGTWCPNCVDEASFLGPWYKANKGRGVEIVSIHYERQTDTAFIRKVFTRFRQRFDIQYTQVLGGVADKQVVAASLPSLNTFLSFPTTIFIGRDGKVDKIHTGYTGPATGKYYEDFKKEFNGEVDALLK
jgi:thiol-disulfide isomerase/thioredoxin